MADAVPNAVRVPVPVLVFAKAPDPGAVKTRLVPALGEGGAAVLAARFARRTLDTATRAAIGPVVLVCAPDTVHPFFEVCRRRHAVTLSPQGAGDLGERMHRAFATTLPTSGAAVLVGTDTPGLHVDDLAEAAQALHDGADVVLGPAEDGGYWLIGLRVPIPALFESIPWSTNEVLGVTRSRIAALDLRAHELAVRADIDRPEDLERLLASDDLASLAADLVPRRSST